MLHLWSLFYPIFKCVDPDPYSEYGSGSARLLNTDPVPGPQHCFHFMFYNEKLEIHSKIIHSVIDLFLFFCEAFVLFSCFLTV